MVSTRVLVVTGVGIAALGCSSGNGPESDLQLECNIPESEIFFGGVQRDGIPALTNPSTVAVNESGFLLDSDRVMGIVLNGEARAYPLPILWWHELINDVVGGRNVLVSYCPLTGSGIAFDPVIDGEPRNFGVSGLLFENNLIMFDRQNESLWNQMSLGASCGVDRGRALSLLPVLETTWGHWKTIYPQTTVVDFNTGFNRNYDRYPYGDYDDPQNSLLTFPSSRFTRDRPPKELNLGIVDGADAVVFPFGVLEEMGDVAAVNDELNGLPFLVTWVGAARAATPFDRRVDGDVLTFSVADAAAVTFTDAETGTTWDVTGLGVDGPLAGTQLRQLEDAFVAFWFAWSIYYPDLRLVE